MNDEVITSSQLEWLRIQLARSTDAVECAKLQKELEEKEAIFDEQFARRLKEIENDGQGVVGSR